MENDDILNKINGAKEQFYSDNSKNSLFKKKQKFECANSIMTKFNEQEVYANIFIVKDDIILFNYPVFKIVANPEIYLNMANYIFMIADELIVKYGAYKLYVNCTGITVSAIERYKDFASVVSKKGLENGKNLLKKMDIIQIHNAPSFVDYGLQVIVPIVDNNLWHKINIVKL